MQRVNAILKNPIYQEWIQKIEAVEEDRIFCRHDITHFLDVARTSMLLSWERDLNMNEELVYATALLHDIGRYLQYQEGTPHEEASSEIAPTILRECGFDEKETAVIVTAIRNHRTEYVAGESTLSGIIYDADKMSRPCFACKGERECSWSKEKKNLYLKK